MHSALRCVQTSVHNACCVVWAVHRRTTVAEWLSGIPYGIHLYLKALLNSKHTENKYVFLRERGEKNPDAKCERGGSRSSQKKTLTVRHARCRLCAYVL